MNWQRRARLVILVFGLVLAGVVFYALRPRELRDVVAPIARLDPKATIETRGGDVIQLKGDRQDVRIEFDGQVSYEDKTTKLMGVKLMVDNRAGRNFVVTGKEARVAADQTAYNMSGDVELTASDGLVANAGEASFTDAEGMVRAPGPVQFHRGRMAGAGIGFTFDQQRNIIALLDQAVVRFAAEGALPPMDVAAGSMNFARADRYMRFERGVRMLRDGQVIEADDATVFLFADRDEPDRIELRGNARITGGTGMGSLRLMSARDINLDYAEDGRTLQQATLAGRSVVQLAGQGEAAGQRLAGEFIDVALGPDGALTNLSGRENVTVALPAGTDTPSRTVRSVQLTGMGAAGAGLTAMKFQENVEFREAATADRPVRIARARMLDARLSAGAGELEEATFTGAFRFEDGALRASSADARYQIAAGTLALSGKEGIKPPQVSDESVNIEAEAIDVTLSPRKMVAKGAVRSTLAPTAQAAGAAGAVPSTARRPGLLGDKEPVNVLADALTYDEAAHRGVYTGQARLWQGETAIHADTITLDEAKGDLSATGKVLTTLALVRAVAGAGAPPPTIVRAATFRYGDETRRAVYDTDTHMNGEQGDLQADHLELVLAAGQNSLDRLEASGKVRALIDKRTATGQKLTYQPSDDRYLMVGAPVTLLEGCRETTGRTLTFFKSSDRVIADGNEQQRTQTKGGGNCSEPPSK